MTYTTLMFYFLNTWNLKKNSFILVHKNVRRLMQTNNYIYIGIYSNPIYFIMRVGKILTMCQCMPVLSMLSIKILKDLNCI